jgi:protocatechuate 3,4-dioxygenase beta subunit
MMTPELSRRTFLKTGLAGVASAEGPYYLAGAPVRTTLVEPGMAGARLSLTGRVLGRAAGCAPLAGATVDFWQADASGAYDANGYTLRGVFVADSVGQYRVETILPGRYLNGATYRPRHLHVKVGAAGRATLTTQLYFEGDPYNAVDAYVLPSLTMPLDGDDADGYRARFDFVLA